MVVGQLELQMFASMARLQSDMDNAKRTVGGAVNSINQVLGTIGVGLSFAGIASLVKGVVDVGDKLNDLSKITGLTVAELGGLGKAAKLNGTDLDSVAKAIGLMSKNMYAGSASFATLGIATKDASGQLRNANQVFLDVADKFSSIEDGAAKSALAAQLFGKSGRDLIPMLNEGRSAIEGNIESYAKYSGMTQQTAQASDQFNDTLAELQGRVTAIKTSFVGALLPTLNTIGAAMLSTGKSTNQFSFAASVVVPVLKGLAITGLTVIDTFRGMGREIGARAAQLTALAELDFKGAAFIGTALAEDNKKARAEFDKLFDTILTGDKSIQNLTETQKEYLKIEQQVPGAVDKTTRALKEKQVLTDAEQLAALRQAESTRSTIELSRQVEQVTQSVATEQEIYNQRLAELEQLKPYLSVETYNRALQKAQEELGKTSDAGKAAYNEIDQYAVQAARNIQTSLANFLFDPFDDGLKGMVKGVANAVRRMVAEFAALKISQALGLQQIFGGISGASSASGGSSTVGMLASLAGMFSGARGGGVNTSSAGVFNANGGAGTAFIGGAGTALGGSGTSRGTGLGMNSGSLMALGSMAGPYGMAAAAAFAVLKVLEKKYGDYKLSGGAKFTLGAYETFSPMAYVVKGLGLQTPEALIGKFLFGRGPYKFRQQSLQGNIASGGLDGTITDVYRSKGAVFTGNRHKSFTDDIPSEIIRDVDKTIKSIYKSTHEFALNLGMDANLVDTFTKEVQVKSEKGKTLTTEAVGEMLSGLNDEIVERVMPSIDSFKLTGETAGEAFKRINSEFEALVSASAVLGVSLNDARTVLRGSTIEGRMAFIDAAGGIDALNSKAQYFAENFLDGSEIVQRNSELLTEQMGKLGLSTDMTKEDFKNLVQSFGKVNGVSEEMLIALLDIAPLFNEVKTAADAAGTSIAGLTEKLVLSKDEMIAVGTVLGNVGYSFDEIMQVLRDLPAEEITAFVQKMGGIEGLLASSGSFAQNFLTGAELAQTKADYLAKQFTDLGVRSDLTAQDFKDLVQGVGEFAGTSLETRAAAALLTDEFVELYGGTNKVADAVSGLNDVAAAASVSVDSLVQAGVDFGLTMQQISALLNSTSPADLANWAKNNSQINQQGDFFKQNFLSPDQQFANDAQDLANKLFKAGIDPNISRSGFTAILQDMTAQNNAAARNLMGLFDSVHDRIEASALAAQNFVAPVAEIINQDAINTAKDRLKDTEGALTQAQNELNQARQTEVNTLQQTVDKYRNYEQAMRNASNALALSAASPLTPMEKYQEANRQLQAAAKSGDYEKLQQAGSAFLEASKLVNASGSQYTADYSFVKGLYDQAAAAAGKQASDAERQLGALGTINNSVLSVAQAVNNLAAAQSAYNAAKSAIPAPVYSTPNVQAPQVLTMPSANFDMSNVIQFPGTSTVSDQQIKDFVTANYGDWRLIYDKAKEYGVSSQRLSSATGIALSDINNWVTANGLPMFERGTDFVQRGGLAVLHPAEAVTPARSMDDMAAEIRGLKQENSEIKRELQEANRLTLALIRTVADSGKRTAEHIVKGGEKQAFYREVKRA